jgi:hypothetical protein
LTLTAVAHSGRDDPTYDLAALGPIGIDHREGNLVGQTERHASHLPVVLARIDALEGRAVEDQRGELEVESTRARFRSLFSGSQAKRT